MSRFQWLEFENPSNPPGEGGDEPPATGGGDPTDPQYILRLADEAYRKMDWEKALKLYSRTLGLDNGIEAAWVGQLRCLLDMNENPEALTWAVKAQKTFGKSPDVQAARALALARHGQTAEALAFSDGSMKADRVGWFPWVVRGEILARTGSANAEFCMSKAREIGATDWLISLKVAQGYKNASWYEKAVPAYKKVLSTQSDLAEAWFELGECHEALGFPTEARDAFERASRLVPSRKKYADAYARTLNAGPLDSVLGWVRRLWKGVTGR
ncbi:MAG: tetratricopeptide repeat protein [Candidatus Riflebacteria bacterium]|nr:tetratricopeptide repeat protein [Candidatus Riflebacteria bacterium]